MTQANQNRITSFQETNIKRINRAFQFIRRGNVLQAFLPLSNEVKRTGNLQIKNIGQHVIVTNNNGVFTAEVYTLTKWKRFYWNIWRKEITGYRIFTDKNFFNVVKQIKSAFETGE